VGRPEGREKAGSFLPAEKQSDNPEILFKGGAGVMSRRLRVGILCGGKSAEHEVSLRSARNIMEAIDKDKYEVVLIGISKEGRWFKMGSARFLLRADDPMSISLNRMGEQVAVLPGEKVEPFLALSDGSSVGSVDVVFPVLHGPFGEDGTVQGMLKLLNVPFVGSGVLSSAVAMDKDVTKRLLRDAGIPVAKFRVLERSSRDGVDFQDVKGHLGLPVFVKPANLGSSVAVNKVGDEEGFSRAMKEAFMYDNKVIVEEYVKGREIECSVLGNRNPVASVPGEIIPRHEFYSYEAKYVDEQGAALEIPAKLGESIVREIQHLAIKTFQVLLGEGMARVDFLLRSDTEIIVNEMNTIPGFTQISMYPKLWEASGISCAELIDRLIQLALERSEVERKLRTSYFA
jgi:D-alanine-D-alanine ligase